ncbi:ATP-dependent DNA helicase PIF1-like protein [Tanacetum coccineum]|uniref:ATP-dependent DNA helicase n=1 Tax=Tanacetum coccineum TaxID=301880 RepID=A0ABQ4ZMU3_9ASTR
MPDVIGTVVGIGDVVAVNSIGARKIRRTIVIEDQEYEGREEYDTNEHKIQLVVHETKIVTPREFMHGAVKQLVRSICETEPETECVIYATVHRIQYESGWTYIGCKICSKKVVPLASKGPSSSKTKQTWWCEKHESQDQVASRYKMIVRVVDESGSAQLCIFNGSMYKMSGYTAWELVEKHGADTTTYFPDELNCIIGKKFLFRVKFTEYNHKNNNHVYRCERVTNDEEIITKEDSEDDLITPTVPIKTKKVLDLSLTRRLQLTSPSTCDIGSSSGKSSGSGKKCSCTIKRSIHVINLSDSEYDTEDDEKSPKRDGRKYDLPTASEVAALIVGDFDSTKHKRDIILERQGGDLKQISELHPSYLALQYPLLFPYAQDGYRTDIYHRGVTDLTPTNKKTRVSMREWFAYRLQDRPKVYSMILNSRRLKPSYIRREQKYLRSETYSKLAKLAADPDSGVTIRDLFITFTCNPNWPKIARFVAEKGLKSEDRPDVITRVFKQKLGSLMKDFKEKRWFGRLRGAVYTVEFQKRGLPHAHILLFLEPEDKLTTAAHIDKYISAEIPDKDEDLELYQIVTDHMMHGPCGVECPSCPCMVGSIKYLFKYINNGQDRVIVAAENEEADEISDYYDCRFPPVERLPFHLPNKQSVIFDESESLDYTLDKASVNETKFQAWMELNKTDTFAQTLLYIEIPKYYVWKHDEKVWQKRQKGESIGRIHHDDFKEFEGVVYPTFKDACYARGLLEDDKEYIDGLLEASHWGMGNYLRRFFVMLIMTDSMSRPEFVYEKTWHVMATDVESIERVKKNAPELILPVVPNGSRQDVVHAAINSSYLWNHCTVMKLTVNMRLGSGSNSSERKEIQDFADWILNIGNGKIGGKNDGEANVEFPDDMLIPDSDDHIGSIIHETYPDLLQNIYDPDYFQERAILAPTHELVDMINDRMLSLLHGDEKTYNSSDTVGVADVDTNFNETMYIEEFLNNLNMAGIPHHSIKLKIGTPVMCMRNIDQRAGLCNGTRLQVLRMGTNVIEAKIISGGSVGTICAIPRMVISPSDTKLPFKLNRRQFPVQICFGMTINKSQGQTLSKVGLFLQRPVFSHGQLYVAVSRVKTKKGLKVLCCDKDGVSNQRMSTLVFVDPKSSTQADGAQSSRVLVPLPEDPYEAIRQAYLVGTDTESESFEDLGTESPESPHTVASPISLPDSTPPVGHVEESEGSDTSGAGSTSSDSTTPLSPDHPLTHDTPVLVPSLRRTIRMAVLVQPMMSPGCSTHIAKVAAMSNVEFRKRFRSSYESSPSSLPTLLDQKSSNEGDESHELDDESCELEDESHGLDDEGRRVESGVIGLAKEATPEGQQQAAPVVETAMSEP